jgi:hypothetical protein
MHQRSEAVVFVPALGDEAVDFLTVGELDFHTGRVDHQLLGEIAVKLTIIIK